MLTKISFSYIIYSDDSEGGTHMKKWTKPQLLNLALKNTKLGGLGGAVDGATYQVRGRILIGTSGPEITDPRFVRRS